MESLTSQTLDKSQYEIILVDDASTDDTWKHIEDWENRFPNIIITVHCDVNGKMGRARNIGLTYASGEYIGYADSDDWTEPEMFEKMLEAAENGKMDVVVCKSIRDHGNDYDKSKAGTGRIDVMNIDSEVKRKEFIVANPMSYACLLYTSTDYYGIDTFLEDVVLAGNDTRKAIRQRVYEEELDYAGINGIKASDYIYNDIANALLG